VVTRLLQRLELLTQLPTAVKDAIPLVRKLGENHLWVDCLCIVQDDEKTREQVDHMGDIYSGAYLTIIAATPLGRLHGFSSPFYGGRAQDEKVEDLYEDLYRTNWASRCSQEEQWFSTIVTCSGNVSNAFGAQTDQDRKLQHPDVLLLQSRITRRPAVCYLALTPTSTCTPR
jgi:hypothetical protein